MIYIPLHILLIIGLLFVFEKKQNSLSPSLYWFFSLAKLFSGLIVGLVFLKYQNGSDTTFLFNQASSVAEKMKDGISPFLSYIFDNQYPSFKSESRNLFIGKVLSFPLLFVKGNYWLLNLYLSLTNLVTALILLNTLMKKYPAVKNPGILALIASPSLFIWSSGVFKETIILSLLYSVTSLTLSIGQSKKAVFKVIGIGICLYMIFQIKFYILPPLVVSFGILIIPFVKKRFNLNQKSTTSLALLGLCAVILVSSQLQHHLDLSVIPKSLHENYSTISKNSQYKNLFEIPFNASWASLAIFSPLSLFTGLFRPFLFEGSLTNIFYWLESLTAICLSIYSLLKIKRWQINYPLVSIIVFVFTLALFLPLATGNFGTLVRYRAVFYPFFLFIISIIPLNDYVSFRQRIS